MPESSSLIATTSPDGVDPRRGGPPAYVAIELDGRRFAVAVPYVVEIVRFEAVTRIPNLPLGVAGVTNVRSRILPVIDLKRFLLGSDTRYPRRSRLVVCTHRGSTFGLHVDRARELLGRDAPAPLPATPSLRDSASRFVPRLLRDSGENAYLGELDIPRLVEATLEGGA